jgi:hypothetical protein
MGFEQRESWGYRCTYAPSEITHVQSNTRYLSKIPIMRDERVELGLVNDRKGKRMYVAIFGRGYVYLLRRRDWDSIALYRSPIGKEEARLPQLKRILGFLGIPRWSTVQSMQTFLAPARRGVQGNAGSSFPCVRYSIRQGSRKQLVRASRGTWSHGIQYLGSPRKHRAT